MAVKRETEKANLTMSGAAFEAYEDVAALLYANLAVGGRRGGFGNEAGGNLTGGASTPPPPSEKNRRKEDCFGGEGSSKASLDSYAKAGQSIKPRPSPRPSSRPPTNENKPPEIFEDKLQAYFAHLVDANLADAQIVDAHLGDSKDKATKTPLRPSSANDQKASSNLKRTDDELMATHIRPRIQAHLAEGSDAVLNQRATSAITAFEKAANLVNRHQIVLKLDEKDRAIHKYALAVAHLDSGIDGNMRKALESLKELAESPTQNWAFCFLGVGRAYCKLNLFAEAVPWLDRGLAAVEKEVLNTGVTHLWPGTTVVIEETKSDHLKKNLQELLKKCKIPLLPEARCRFEDCKEPQREIYFSNIPYNGCVILKCEKNCGFAYHRTCWNKIEEHCTKSNKDIVGKPCATPGCDSIVVQLKVMDHTTAAAPHLLQLKHDEQKEAPQTPKRKKKHKRKDKTLNIDVNFRDSYYGDQGVTGKPPSIQSVSAASTEIFPPYMAPLLKPTNLDEEVNNIVNMLKSEGSAGNRNQGLQGSSNGWGSKEEMREMIIAWCQEQLNARGPVFVTDMDPLVNDLATELQEMLADEGGLTKLLLNDRQHRCLVFHDLYYYRPHQASRVSELYCGWCETYLQQISNEEKLQNEKEIVASVSKENCPICLTEMMPSQTFHVPECKHAYHQECIDKWLKEKPTCPLCQKRVSKPNEDFPEPRGRGPRRRGLSWATVVLGN